MVGQSGCLACHKIGDNGNDGPGPDLTHIGSILLPGAIASTLRNPTAPMPSFKSLAVQYPEKFQNLVGFLSSSSKRLPSGDDRERTGRRRDRPRHARGDPGAGDVRSHRGLYDRLNTVMTAGLHHEWRRRAADLAALSVPATGRSTSPPAPAIWRSSSPRRVGPGGEVVGLGLLRADARARAREGERASATGVGSRLANALALPYADGAFDAATVGFGARNFSDLRARACARWRGSCARAAASSCSRSRRRNGRPLSTFFELWFDRVVPVLGRLAGDADAYSYLPNSVRRFPGPERARCDDVRAAACAGSATC